MLRGSIIHGYDYDYDGGKFSDLCLRRMDGDQGPWESELNVVAMVLLGVAWLALVLELRWQLKTKAVAALPGLITLALAGVMAIGDSGNAEDGSSPGMLVLAMPSCSPSSLWSRSWPGNQRLVVAVGPRLVVVLWGTTAFGVIHVMAEYAIMIRFSDANWDRPPASGTSRSPPSPSAPS